MVYIVGGVLSRSAWTATVGGFIPPLSFHAVTMALGAWLLGRTSRPGGNAAGGAAPSEVPPAGVPEKKNESR
ncbi:MAG: hypothetical protein KA419_01675 [Acidobacteria bacterium]|nr:hypothetical protein [Acidobacteriota bacterium]